MLRTPRQRVSCQDGFTLVELMVTISLVAILMMLAVPAFTGMLRNSQVRTVADALQNGLRLAQSEAIRRNHQTVFTFTNAQPGENSTAAANGMNWALHLVLRPTDPPNDPRFLQGAALAESASGVTVSGGPTAVCFSSNGRLAVNAAPGVTGATCEVDGAVPLHRYTISRTGADRRLQVTLSLNGQVRMCDPEKTLSPSTPDGCPP